MAKVHLRFRGDLNFFLPQKRKYRFFPFEVKDRPSVKDTLEAVGVPHTEIAGIKVNGHWFDFNYQILDQDLIEIYPPDHPGLATEKKLWPRIPSDPCFVLDSHLGKLAKYLRLLGIDCCYHNHFPDPEIIRFGVQKKHIILTRDRGILKHRQVRYGYCLRSTIPGRQVRAVIRRYQLKDAIRPFTRCLECNGSIKKISKNSIAPQLPAKSKQYYDQFFQCRNCLKIYWQGSHFNSMLRRIRKFTTKSPHNID